MANSQTITEKAVVIKSKPIKKDSFLYDLKINKALYIMAIPVLLFYIIFMYKPMYGALIAFMDYSPGLGFADSPWVGFTHFINFFRSPDFWKLLRNTVRISMASLVFGFPAPIILALLINELKNKTFKKLTQTVSYMPHFISIVVICGMIKEFVGSDGIVTMLFSIFTGKNDNMLNNKDLFTPIYVLSGIWQEVGWSSIIYLAALSSVDEQLYEAAKIDGAGRWRILLNITIPSIVPTIVVMLILRVGQIMSLGFEKVILLYNPLIYETSDIISTYVYRLAFDGRQWSYTTAIGLFNSVINFSLVICANKLSKKVQGTSLW